MTQSAKTVREAIEFALRVLDEQADIAKQAETAENPEVYIARELGARAMHTPAHGVGIARRQLREALTALQAVGQLSTPENKEAERDATRYRALRQGLIASVGEDGELLLSLALGGEFEDCAEPITPERAPFLTATERAHLNGSAQGARGYLRLDAVDRIVDHLITAGAPAGGGS